LNFLRGLGTFILSFLLFVSLSIFSLAFLIQSTILNPDFVSDQVDRIDLSELTHDFTEENIVGEIPGEARFLQDAVYDVINDQEPWFKEQFHNVIYAGYDFLLGKSDTLEISIRLESLKESLRESLWEALNEQISTWLPDIVRSELRPYIEEHLEEYTRQIPEEYLPEGITGLDDELLLDFIDPYLQEIDEQITNEGLMPQVTGLLEALIRPYYDQYFDEFVAGIPSEIVYNEETIPADVMEQLFLARNYIGYFQAGYYWLIVFMVLLAAGIFLVNWNFGKAALALSIDLLVFGVLETAGILFAKNLGLSGLLDSVPSSLQSWLTSLYNDILSVMLTFNIAVLIAGIILLVVGIVFKRRASRAPDSE